MVCTHLTNNYLLTYLLIYLLSYLLTCLFTPWMSPSWEANHFSTSRRIPKFYGTQKFITAFAGNQHMSLCGASSIQSASRGFILILSFLLCLGLPSGLFTSDFPTRTLYMPFTHMHYMPCPFHSSRLFHQNIIQSAVQIIKLLII